MLQSTLLATELVSHLALPSSSSWWHHRGSRSFSRFSYLIWSFQLQPLTDICGSKSCQFKWLRTHSQVAMTFWHFTLYLEFSTHALPKVCSLPAPSITLVAAHLLPALVIFLRCHNDNCDKMLHSSFTHVACASKSRRQRVGEHAYKCAPTCSHTFYNLSHLHAVSLPLFAVIFIPVRMCISIS